MSFNFLLEIGTEEIPHWMIPGALKDIKETGPPWTSTTVDATPRRIVVRGNFPERQADDVFDHTGPPESAGRKAAEGFARKFGVAVDQLWKVETPKGIYYQHHEVIPGRPYLDVLAVSVPDLIKNIYWPKTMYWAGGRNGPRFIRPIRWIVALLGDQVIPFEVAGVKSGNITRGHRQLGAASIPVTIANYESELRRNGVILSSEERRKKIEAEAIALGATIDPGLRETLTYITEFPSAIRGDFNPAYLELPAEVLITVMRHHQKYFAVEDAPGRLAPHFVAVLNTNDDPEGLVKHGNERVLKARFNDARFFWNVDQQKQLVDRVADLAKVTFQAKLGSYEEKTNRVVALVKELGGNGFAQRAALLCKCDLTTDMVKEFTDLQGIVGGLYAKAQGEPEQVWRAIYDHYKPVSMEDSIPSTKDGQIVALADKLDTLRECFRIGMMPTGSKDPFALRRAAQGVIKILAEAQLPFDLNQLVQGELLEFLLDRVKYYFREVRGYKYDEVNAVRGWNIADVELRLEALSQVRPTENFEPLAASFKRIRNILTQANFQPSQPFNPALLETEPEKELYVAYSKVHEQIQDASYVDSLTGTATLRPAVDHFFDSTLVNAPDPQVRTNRLTLLHQLLTEFSTIADFSEIVTSGDQK